MKYSTQKKNNRAMPGRWLITLAIGVLISIPAWAASAGKGGSVWGANYFPNIELISHDGEKLRFYDDLLEDKVVIINFIFTSCPDSCPLETARLAEVQKILGDRVGKDVFIYSISIDPDRDTVEVLKAYTEKFQIGPGWLFLTGDEQEIIGLRRKLGLYIEEIQGEDSTDHNLNLVIGNQATGRWMKRSPFENPYVLASEVGGQLHNWKLPRPEDRNYADAPKLRTISKGESLFRTRCASCHTIGGGDIIDSDVSLVGPDLLDVTKRRQRNWLIRWLAEPDRMLEEQDPIAIALLKQFNDVPMPNMRLNAIEIDSLLRYIQTQSQQVNSDRTASTQALRRVQARKTLTGGQF